MRAAASSPTGASTAFNYGKALTRTAAINIGEKIGLIDKEAIDKQLLKREMNISNGNFWAKMTGVAFFAPEMAMLDNLYQATAIGKPNLIEKQRANEMLKDLKGYEYAKANKLDTSNIAEPKYEKGKLSEKARWEYHSSLFPTATFTPNITKYLNLKRGSRNSNTH